MVGVVGARMCFSTSPASVRCGSAAGGGVGWSRPPEAPPAKSRAAKLPDNCKSGLLSKAISAPPALSPLLMPLFEMLVEFSLTPAAVGPA